MNKIKILSSETVSKISAGEVIERPSSVVKELIENSIDANAKNISIYLEKFGKNLISVSDDGIGMEKNDLEVAVLRHATSKLNEENIYDINNLGFRGEALYSIASVSKLSIVSRHIDNNLGYKLSLIGGKNKTIEALASNVGTKIEVRDLFFSIPVRLKFLRSDRAELNSILSIVKKLSLSHPHINFELHNSNKVLFTLKSPKDMSYDQALKQRVLKLLGKDFIKNSVFVNYEYQKIKIYGYISLATFHRVSSEDQFIFLNNRPIKDKLLSIALKISYQDILIKDKHPVVVLFIKMNNTLFDVNVHPNKIEVKFLDPIFIRSNFIQAIKKALQENNRTSSTISDQAIKYMQNSLYKDKDDKDFVHLSESICKIHKHETSSTADINNSSFVEQRNNNFGIQKDFLPDDTSLNKSFVHNSQNFLKLEKEFQNTKNPIDRNFSSQKFSTQNNFYSKILPTARTEHSNQNIKNFIDYPMGSAKTQINDSYIISQTNEALIIIDQHAADERIVYEKIKNQLSDNQLLEQKLLIPEIVEFADNKYVDLLIDQQEHLSKLALKIESITSTKVQVNAIPAILSQRKINIQDLVRDIAYSLCDEKEDNILSNLLEKIFKTYACHYSIRANKKLSILEMNELLRAIEKTKFSAQCNHGRPTYIKLTIKEIEKLFNRI